MSDISDEQLEELKLCFDIFDKSGGREVVSSSELQAMLQSVKLSPITSHVQKVIKDSDLEGKEIDFATFVTVYSEFESKPVIATLQDMIDAFKTMDREGGGYLPGAVLRNVVTIMGDAMTEQQYEDLLARHEDKETSDVKFDDMIKAVMSG